MGRVSREYDLTTDKLTTRLVTCLLSRDAKVDATNHWGFNREGEKLLQVLEASNIDARHLSKMLLLLKKNPPTQKDVQSAEFTWVCVNTHL